MKTGGPIRGMAGRWLMRMQAIQGILGMVTSGITAASTLTFALQSIGYVRVAPFVLAAGVIGTPAFAYAYTEYGVFNRKNRENSDRGANWAGPDSYMNSVIGSMGTFYAMNHRVPDEGEFEEMQEAVRMAWEPYRDGIDITDD